MYKLWNANFARLRMSATFRVGILVAAVLGLVCPTLGAWFSNKIVALTNGALGHYVEEGMSLDYFLFTWVLFLAVYLHCIAAALWGQNTVTAHFEIKLRQDIPGRRFI